MSVSSEVQRTLVKSPPELWAELSDPAALARHLGELGEIRITRVEPEKSVEWEATDASGTVLLKPSGWGTKVTLTVTRELPAPEPVSSPEPVLVPDSIAVPEPIAAPDSIAASDPIAISEPEPEVATEPRRGFFARIFGRRRNAAPAPAPLPEPEPLPKPEPELQLQPEPEPQPEPELQEEPQPDLAAELAALEESLVAEARAVLTSVLDRLGAAHHRPFSRS